MDFTRPQPRVILVPSSSMLSYWEVTVLLALKYSLSLLWKILQAFSSWSQTLSGYCAAFSTRRTSAFRLFEPSGTGDKRQECNCQGRMCCAPINGSLLWKRSIVGVGMTFYCHCWLLIEASLREGGRACWNILQLRTPRAPGARRDIHSIVILLKDIADTSFPLSPFWLSLLKLDKISLPSDASIQLFWHPFIVNNWRTCDLVFFEIFFFSVSTLCILHSRYITHSLLGLHLRPSKVMQSNFLAFSCYTESLSVLGAAGASWKPHDPHQTVRWPQRTCRLLYKFASCSISGWIALFPPITPTYRV